MSDSWVVDSSVAAKWVLPEADSAAALSLRGSRLIAPAFLDIECANILWKAARRGEISVEEARDLHALLLDVPVERLPEQGLLSLALDCALALSHPVYDCLYLAAAELTGFPLVTADRRLRTLQRRGVRIVGLDALT
jgi:predicted nucleic acid-binding protein